jgi:putative transposase
MVAAKTFFRKLLESLAYVPRGTVTDELRSYEAAKLELRPSVEHRQHRYLRNYLDQQARSDDHSPVLYNQGG